MASLIDDPSFGCKTDNQVDRQNSPEPPLIVCIKEKHTYMFEDVVANAVAYVLDDAQHPESRNTADIPRNAFQIS
jgi:hypothetical protein